MNRSLPIPPPPAKLTFRWANWGILFSLLILLGGSVQPTTVLAVDVSGTVTLTPGTYNDDYTFTGTSGILNADTQASDFINLRGTISSAENATGEIRVYGNSTVSASPALSVQGDASNFRGKVVVGQATQDTPVATDPSNGQRNWLVFQGATATGFAKAEVNLRTKTNSGMWPGFDDGSASNRTYYFGALTGSGRILNSCDKPTYKIGALRTQSADVDVFHGYFEGGINLVKEGSGTWILTGKQGQKNQLLSIQITDGTLQVGDYGHVYGADDLYYTQGTVGTGANNTSTIIGTVGITVGANGALAFGQSTAQTISNALTFSAATSVISNVNPNAAVTLSGTLATSSGFTKTGAGRVILAPGTGITNTLGGTVTLKEGWLQTTRTNLGTASVRFDGGKLNLTAGDLGSSEVTRNGGTLDYASMTLNGLTNADDSKPTFVITRSRDVTNFTEGTNLGSLDSAGVDLFADFKGTIQVDANAIVSLGSATNFEKTAFHLTSNNSLWTGLHVARPVVGRVWKLGDLTGEGLVNTSKNTIYANRGVAFEIGSLGNDSTFSGTFANNRRDSDSEFNLNEIDVKKVGSGTWTFGPTATADSVFNIDSIANITVSDGALALNRRSGIASAKTLSVESGTELQILSEGQKITEGLSMLENSKLSFTLSGTENAALLTVGSLAWNDDVTMEFLTTDDFLENIHSGMTLNILDSTNLSGEVMEAFTSAWKNNSLLSTYFLPLFSDTSLALQVNSAAVPEPSTLWLLLLGGLWIVVRRVRKG
ncbi:MAG: PEP-CTERM sorting domain-containing protein [Planctomycetia bacterium]|nr:PEP-CTERM sorting domain-containing protein [Planctomycetia bacterium]